MNARIILAKSREATSVCVQQRNNRTVRGVVRCAGVNGVECINPLTTAHPFSDQ